ncbi:MAG: hypothetical protein JNN20_08320 [Betaproteobacteria bacterium]|nr:hypothetical protein [Betaproteobacteria bacterium]
MPPIAHLRRLLLAACLGFVSFASAQSAPAPAAPPADPRVFGLLSLIGDELNIVIARGAKADGTRNEPLPVAEPMFDNAAIQAAGTGIRKVIPRAELAVLNTRSQVLFDRQRELFAEANGVMKIPDAIRDALKSQQATHLMLIAKHSGVAQMHFAGNSDGTAQVEGLGFCIDASMLVENSSTAAAQRGMIAPFAYINVSLVDLSSSKVLKKQTIAVTSTISSARAQQSNQSPWLALSAAEKVSIIDRLVQREVGRTAQEIMQAAK